MPLKSGYSYETVSENIGEMMRAGHMRDSAIAASMALARKHFFKRRPGGFLPRWLQFPKGRGNRSDYGRSGAPAHARSQAALAPNPPVLNPSMRSDVRAAQRLGQAFSGHRQNRMLRVRQPGGSKARLAIGPVTGIMYLAKRDGKVEQYLHRFGKGSRPLLAATPDGTRLELLGGAFRFTEKGIEDRPVSVKRSR